MTELLPATSYRLSDRSLADTGTVFLSGVQALARLPLEQLRRDRRAGRSTAAFLSGYPGSPLGGFDREAMAAAAAAPDLPIVVRPAVNEELAATAVMGSQLAAGRPDARYDGVLGIWYGKTPGLDRAGDALRHAIFAGADPAGGAVAFVGDDPSAKSSTLPSSSERTIEALAMPMFVPGSVSDVVELGRHAVAMSRASGAWVALRVVSQVADGTGTVGLAGDLPSDPPEWDDLAVPTPSGRLLAPYSLDLERELVEVRLELARRYAALRPIDVVHVAGRSPWLGILAVGAVHGEVVEAFGRLGLGLDDLHELGVRLLQVRQPFPLDVGGIRRLAAGLAEIVVVEEKRAFVEPLVRDALYGTTGAPPVLGKLDDAGRPLLRSYGVLDADSLVEPLRGRLLRRVDPDRLAPPLPPPRVTIPLSVNRAPHFCSGCPHNTSTKVPDGALVGGGIGCSSIIALMPETQVGELIGLTSMGNEGANWIGMAPFVERPHLLQYLGDGTYAHSGHLAVRAAVAAGVGITFKILYNGAVSMTGGQHPEGVLSVPDLARSMLLEGAARVLITTDDVRDYDGAELPSGVEVWARTRMVEAQEVLAAVPGTTVLIHDQACAAELRRARKRGTRAEPTTRVVINERVCEGCGDCGAVSNCLSVQPVDTPYGRKTRIDQASCNLDLSCLGGDCPAFATVEVAAPTRRAPRRRAAPADALPEPVSVSWTTCTVRMSGIGGTGVVTVSQVLGTAALLDGRHAVGLDQTGLSQKAGPVVSDLRLSVEPQPGSNRAPRDAVDVELAFDLLVAATPLHLAGSRPGHTVVIGSTSATPTGSMVVDPALAAPTVAELRERLDAVSDPARSRYVDAAALCAGLVGDTTPANVLLLGVAVQEGVVPLTPASVERAIELNGVAVERNVDAFRWGRRWALDPDAVEQQAGCAVTAPESIDELIDRLQRDLTAYQSPAYAARWRRLVDAARAAESTVGSSTAFTTTVAREAHRLMAYKDEYEVARLLLAPEARTALDAVGGRGARVIWHLRPPLLTSFGLDRKLALGRWSRPGLAILRRTKRLRGTVLDPFGRGEVRRVERVMVGEYERAVTRLIAGLHPDRLDEAVAIAGLPDSVRGYESLKLRRAEAYRAELARRLDAFEGR